MFNVTLRFRLASPSTSTVEVQMDVCFDGGESTTYRLMVEASGDRWLDPQVVTVLPEAVSAPGR